jgi:hypothetical protein
MHAMDKVDFTYWATMEKWKEEAAALFLGLDPTAWHGPKWEPSAAKYSGLLRRMIDATNHHRIPYPWTPARWLA